MGGSSTAVQYLNASPRVFPCTVLYGAKQSELSLYKRTHVSQSVCALGTCVGRFFGDIEGVGLDCGLALALALGLEAGRAACSA